MKIDFCFLLFICIVSLGKSQIPNSLINFSSFIDYVNQTKSFDTQLLYNKAKSFSSVLKNFQDNKISLSNPCNTDIKKIINGLWSKQDWSFKSIYKELD